MSRPRTRTLTAIAVACTLAACTPGQPTTDTKAPEIGHAGDVADGRTAGQLQVARPTTAITQPAPAPTVAESLENAARHPIGADGRHKLAVSPAFAGSGPTVDRERYGEIHDNGVQRVAKQPVSTFSIDVDTASYANVRRILNEGRLPPADAVRIEELVNYFAYDDPLPEPDGEPLRVTTELATTPWNPDSRLLRIALRTPAIATTELPPSNLVFLVDVSGSMNQPDKLPLLRRALTLLVRQLDADDRVSLVVYAGAAGVVLEPTPGNERAKIEQALAELTAGGSTHGSAGIRLAYAKAREAFIEDGINRVILATDGDFNVGTVDHRALLDLVEREGRGGIGLTTLGFGRGNLNDHLMEQLADHGDGNAAYIDSLLEAQKVLVEQLGGTLHTVASDVKLQVEFNPARVAEYRLIGYENRLLQREDFNDDAVDAGEIGAGHSVVALYEIVETGSPGLQIDPLRYGPDTAGEGRAPTAASTVDELAYVKLRYKPAPDRDSRLMQLPVTIDHFNASGSEALRFSAAVAAFGQHLRGAPQIADFDLDRIRALAAEARGDDPNGHRSAFLRLIALADALQTATPVALAPNDVH
jgi:Ca-activated chloride channel family protein